jgi:hypothetical protein
MASAVANDIESPPIVANFQIEPSVTNAEIDGDFGSFRMPQYVMNSLFEG